MVRLLTLVDRNFNMLAEHLMHASVVLYEAHATMHYVLSRAIPMESVLSTPECPGPHCQSHASIV